MLKKIGKNKSILIILAVLLCVSAMLRLYELGKFPVGFQIDEASLGYNAYSLLQTGKSDEGKFLPLYVDIFGDNRPSGYHFLAIVPVAIFGLSEFSTRLPGAVFGLLSIIPFYFLTLYLSKDRKVALVSALFLSIAPWHTVLSRASAETVVALFLIIAGFYFLLKSLGNQSRKTLIIAAICLISSFFFYHTPRVFVPLMFIATTLLFYKNLLLKKHRTYTYYYATVLFLVCIASFSLVFLIKGGAGRFTQVNVFSHPETQLVLAEQYREDGTFGVGPLSARFFHNKVVNFGFDYTANYLEYFSGDFLFISGGLPNWYEVDRMGLLHIFQAPFLLIGALLLVAKRTRLSFFPLIWILLSPIVAALTIDDIPNLQRAIVLFPMLDFVAAYGVVGVLVFLRRKIKWAAIIIICLVVLYSEAYFLHQYFIHGKAHRTWYRNNGFAEMMSKVNESYDTYDKIVITKTGGGYPLVLFYSQYNPAKYIEEGSPKDPDYKGFGKFIFVPIECPSVNASVDIPKDAKALYVDRGTCPEPVKKRFKNIYREDGSLGFRVVY